MASGRCSDRLRLAIIGAGASGLVAARHALARPDRLDPVIFEQTGRIGGTWVYTDDIYTDSESQQPVHSSMYKNLRTNLPKEVMAYLDFPFQPQNRSFVGQADVLEYLTQYAEHFRLKEHIKFHTRVILIKPFTKTNRDAKTNRDENNKTNRNAKNNRDEWEIEVEDARTKQRRMYKFDSVIVCNGHFSQPMLPPIEGLEIFKGSILHSHSYRQPEVFSKCKVACLGAGFSAIDIGGDLTKHASMVYLSHNKEMPLVAEAPPNLSEVPGIVAASETGVTTKDGQFHEVDVIILCTGYKYHCPFLAPECDIKVKSNYVSPLYKHVVSIKHPTMAFIGLPTLVCPFPLFDVQVQFYLATLTGILELPSETKMMEQFEGEMSSLKGANLPMKHAHRLGLKQWEYMAELSNLAGCRLPPKSVENLYKHLSEERKTHTFSFKDVNYAIVGEESFVAVNKC